MDIAGIEEEDFLYRIRLSDPAPFLPDESRLPMDYSEDASDKLAGLPPLVLRPPGPTVCYALLCAQLEEADLATHYSHATATENLASTEEAAVREAMDHVITLHAESDELAAIPLHACDVLVSDHRAAVLQAPDGTTLLEAIAARIAPQLEHGDSVSLVGSSHRYISGTTLVQDDFARVYPDDRTMSRAVVSVPCCGYGDAALGVLDRAVLGILLVVDDLFLIKSLPDVISTVYNAMLVSSPDEMARVREGGTPAQCIMSSLSRHAEPRIAATFSVLQTAIASASVGADNEANKALFLAHALTSAYDLLEYEHDEDGLREFFEASLVVAGLRDLGVVSASSADLDDAAGLLGDHAETVFRVLNETLPADPGCFRLPTPDSLHAAVDLAHIDVLAGAVTVRLEKPVDVKNEQCKLLSAPEVDTKTFTVLEGDLQGISYTFQFQSGKLQTLKSTNTLSHFCRRIVHKAGRLGARSATGISAKTESSTDFPVEASEALDECLVGSCGPEGSRWVLSMIYSKSICVSNLSDVSYIPETWKVSDESAPVVSAMLDCSIVRQMACIVPESLDALYVIFKQDGPVMKARIQSNTLYLQEEKVVDLECMRQGVLSSDYTIG